MKNYSKIQAIVEDIYPIALEESFGTWIHGIFFSDTRINNFKEQCEVFFWLLEKLLEEGKAIVFPAQEFWDNEQKAFIVPTRSMNEYKHIWDISPREVTQYMRSTWPNEVTHEDDLTDYWFGNYCPRLGWVKEDGTIVAS